MGDLADRLAKIYEAHRQKIDKVERETAAAVVDVVAELERRMAGTATGERKLPFGQPPSTAATVLQPEVIKPLTQLETAAGSRIALIKADITRLAVDAIVNPASRTLEGGGGLEGRIFAAGGQDLIEECHGLGGVERGEAKITPGHKLLCRFVIHTAGPVWKGGDQNEPQMLASCYQNSLKLAKGYGLKSVAFPAISTGNFGYPLDQATRVAVQEIARFLMENKGLEVVYLVGFGDDAVDAFKKALQEITA
ncbi:MAG: Appr-1-p processing domain protein [Verrucomicrobia bacterium]|jgi:O-acetyl-ADP-ribose deacetylase (regulator of RNase III)|nr:Appr-1-p processing domain protein [Verrucomicrobiota bacterium]